MLIVICLFFNYTTKVQRKIETTKYFMLKSVNYELISFAWSI